MTQPTVSVQVSSLEKELGVTLFERSRRATLLTPQGRALPLELPLLKNHK